MDLRLSRTLALGAVVVVPLGIALLGYTALTQPPAAVETSLFVESAPPPADHTADAQNRAAPLPAPTGTSRIADSSFRERMIAHPSAGDKFAAFDANGVQVVAENPVSTFSIDVDTASYAYIRQALRLGQAPAPDAVRVEELINYFDYAYDAPAEDGAPFAPSVAVTPSPWNAGNKLVHIGIKGRRMDIGAVAPANLVFLIDTSGSMNAQNKLPLLKRAFGLLINEMGPKDTISIVTYAGSAGVALEPTSAGEKAKILAALDALKPGGSTAGSEGIVAAYRLAEQAFIKDGTNRVLLATDGDFNVGISEPGGLEQLIADKRRSGIFLSILGFGSGNYNDAGMQALAQAGNGNAAYIDTYSEARKVLVEELGGTLLTIAKDVKLQVEFNPETVSEYRLIGYETRLLNREDFNNDAVDAGDIGAGHNVTALYEITPKGAQGAVDPLRYERPSPPAAAGNAGEYGFLKIRYKAPDGDVSTLIETPISVAGEAESIGAATDDTRFAVAVAAFGQKLRKSAYLDRMDWAEIRALAQSARGEDPTGRRAEFLQLIDAAAQSGS
ncbi:vWA domain-containing protein [Terrihabitans sp. B22-R8]|uniref:vWA domain-containing protein n=1 Tax=Terrihabitans sp. B22-R8 TaxID=3425128 RepID=UPI00403C1206